MKFFSQNLVQKGSILGPLTRHWTGTTLREAFLCARGCGGQRGGSAGGISGCKCSTRRDRLDPSQVSQKIEKRWSKSHPLLGKGLRHFKEIIQFHVRTRDWCIFAHVVTHYGFWFILPLNLNWNSVKILTALNHAQLCEFLFHFQTL